MKLSGRKILFLSYKNISMKITFLGTGTSQGVPVIASDCPVCQSEDPKDKRLRTSAMIEWEQYRYIIDCGPDFRMQMLRENVHHIDGILFTHEHADHTAGLDDIRPLYFKQKQPIPIYALPRVIENLKIRFDYIFKEENRYPGAPRVDEHALEPYQKISLGNKLVEPLAVNHGPLPILGYKIGNMAYITDAKTLPQKTVDALKNIDILIINALHHKPHKMHMNLEESLTMIDKIKPKKAFLTHISHYMGKYIDIVPQLPENVFMAYDGLIIDC